MNLVVDFGNTRIKLGLFDGNDLLEKQIYDTEGELVNAVNSFSNIQNCLIASVTTKHNQVLEIFNANFKTQLFAATTPTPLKNLYKSSLTLGSDRIAASTGSYSFFPNQNVLTIDAGTCIKYNFVNANNEYIGGAISPGIPMRLKAMNYYTSALPLVEPDKMYKKLIGETSAESLLSGAIVGAACEADEMINRYRAEFENLQIVITGGDADYLCNQVKNRFFTNQNILLYGLNSILNFNLEK